MKKSILAGAAFLATAAIAMPMLAWSAGEPGAQPGAHERGDHARGDHERGDHDGKGMGHHGWGRHMAMRSPQQRCEARIAHRAARVAYVTSLLNLTAEQRPLYAKVAAAMQGTADKEHQLCAALPTDAKAPVTVLDRLNQRAEFIQAQLTGLQQVQPALQALYQSLTPAQKAIIDHPFHRG